MISRNSDILFFIFFASIWVASLIFLYEIYSFQYYAEKYNSENALEKPIDIKYKMDLMFVPMLMVVVFYLRRLNGFIFRKALEQKLKQKISQKVFQYQLMIDKIQDLQFNFTQYAATFLIGLYLFGSNLNIPTWLFGSATSNDLLTKNWPLQDHGLPYIRAYIQAQLGLQSYRVTLYNWLNFHTKYNLELSLTNYMVLMNGMFLYYTNQETLAVSFLMLNDFSEAILNFGKWFKELNKGDTLVKRASMNFIFLAMFVSFSYARVIAPFFTYMSLAYQVLFSYESFLTNWEYGFSIKWTTNLNILTLFIFWATNILWQIVMVQIAVNNINGKKQKPIEKVWKVE